MKPVPRAASRPTGDAVDDGDPGAPRQGGGWREPRSRSHPVDEESYRLLISSVKDYAIFMLDPAGRIRTWNEGARRIKGYATAEVIGLHFSVFYERPAVATGVPDWELAVAEREGRFEDEGWRLRKDGSRFWANVVITTLRDASGQVRGFAKVTRDITERRAAEQRRLEQQRNESNRLREHASRMAQLEKMKSDFLNLASHELRGPLALVRGYMSLFEDGTLAPDELRGVLPILSAKVEEMELLVQQMLETARLEDDRLGLHIEPFDLRKVAERAVGRFRLLVSDRHALRLSLPDRPVRVIADRGRIETVVANLVDNAIKYSPSGGVIRCTVGRQAGRVLVGIQDEGIGISSDSMGQLFTRFRRIVTPATAHVGGTGLGLYVSRELARRHGGDVLVESEVGQGSRFTLVLPAP